MLAEGEGSLSSPSQAFSHLLSPSPTRACSLKHDSPLLAHAGTSRLPTGGWQLACRNSVVYLSPGCHDRVPDTCTGWRSMGGAGNEGKWHPLPNVSASSPPEAYAAHLQLLSLEP